MKTYILFLIFSLFIFAQIPTAFKEDPDAKVLAEPGTNFYFDIIEISSAKYLGDVCSYTGKHGGLNLRPRIAVGDAVMRTNESQEEIIGNITEVCWNRVAGSLEIKFCINTSKRVCVGEEVYIDINPKSP